MKTILLTSLFLWGLSAQAMGFISCNGLLDSKVPAMNAMLLSYEAEVKQTALSRAVRNLLDKKVTASDKAVKAKFIEIAQIGASSSIDSQVFGLTEAEQLRRSAVFNDRKSELLEGAPAGTEEAVDQKIMKAVEQVLENVDQLILDANELVPEVEKDLQVFFKQYVEKEKSSEELEQIYISQTHNKEYVRIFDRWVLEAKGETFAPGFTSKPEDPDDVPPEPKLGFID